MLYKYVDKNKKRKQKGSYRKVDELLSDQVLFVRWSKTRLAFCCLVRHTSQPAQSAQNQTREGPLYLGAHCSRLYYEQNWFIHHSKHYQDSEARAYERYYAPSKLVGGRDMARNNQMCFVVALLRFASQRE